MEFMKRALGEFHKFHVKCPRMLGSIYHVTFNLSSMGVETEPFFKITVSVMTLSASNEVLCNV